MPDEVARVCDTNAACCVHQRYELAVALIVGAQPRAQVLEKGMVFSQVDHRAAHEGGLRGVSMWLFIAVLV